MITIQGKGVSTGIAMGPLYFYRRAKTEIKRYTVTDTQAECNKPTAFSILPARKLLLHTNSAK